MQQYAFIAVISAKRRALNSTFGGGIDNHGFYGASRGIFPSEDCVLFVLLFFFSSQNRRSRSGLLLFCSTVKVCRQNVCNVYYRAENPIIGCFWTECVSGLCIVWFPISCFYEQFGVSHGDNRNLKM